MSDLATCITLCLLQPERSQTATNAIQFTVITGVFVIVVAVVLFYVIRAVRPKVDSSASDAMREDFEKSKEALLLAAQAKKAAREAGESAERQQDAEEQERELDGSHPWPFGRGACEARAQFRLKPPIAR